MDYQITCVCGHRFLVSEDRVHGQVTCPNCRQRLSPVIDTSKAETAAPPAGTQALLPGGGGAPGEATPRPESDPARGGMPPARSAVPASAEETKRCPYCGEVILAIARKCKHCGEFLDQTMPGGAGAAGFPAGGGAGANLTTADVPPVYALTVSQWDNFWKFIILLAICALVAIGLVLFKREYAVVGTMGSLVIAGFVGWFFYLAARNTRVYIRPLRIDTEQGILSKDLNTLELFRVTDIELKQGIVERVLRIGTIRLKTSDETQPEVLLYQIPRAREVYKYLQNQIPLAARTRGAIYMEK